MAFIFMRPTPNVNGLDFEKCVEFLQILLRVSYLLSVTNLDVLDWI